MSDRENKSANPADDLRKRAEDKFRVSAERAKKNIETLSPEETSGLFHELQVHQIELEMQNEELRRAQAELEASRTPPSAIHDFLCFK